MKLGLKIILPILLLLVIILGAFGYLLYSLREQDTAISSQGERIQKLNSLNEKLVQEQEQTDYNVLAYRFNPSRSFLSTISQAELDKSETLDEMFPFITTQRGLALVNNYIDSRKKVEYLRNALIKAIDGGDKDQITINYNNWNAQTQNIKASLADIKAYNIGSLEQTLTLVEAIGNKITQIIFILVFVIIATILFLYFYMRNVITIPIIKLSKFAEEVANGNFTTTTTMRKDELGTLSRAFNSMLAKLKESYGTLEQKVNERTASLMEKTREVNDSQKAVLNILEDLKIQEEELVEGRARDEAILSSIGDGLVMVDKEGKIIYINRSFEKILGWTAQEVIGRKMTEVVPGEYSSGTGVQAEDRILSQVLSGEKFTADLANPYYFTRKDKSRFPASIIVTSVVLGGRIVGAVETFRDVTEEKRLDEAKSSFISIASHQLMTPLTSVRWYSEILLDEDTGKLNKEQKEFATQVHEGALRLFRTISTLLSLSRLESGKIQENLVRTNLRNFSEKIFKDVESLAKDRNLEISLDLKEDTPDVLMDVFMFREVVTNLIANSIRYTHKGGKINLGFKYDGKEIICSVFDNGIGIPGEEKDKIFDKFYRASNAVKKAPDGSGLGLSLVKNFVEKWGGRIWFESEVEEGSTFFFTIPEKNISKN